MLKIQHLTKQFGAVPLFTGLCMEVDAPAVLWAPSGWGKTTLLRILMGLERPTTGSVEGVGRVAAVFQEDRLCPQLNAVQNVTLVLPGTENQYKEQIISNFQLVGMDAAALQLPARRLSGGQKRRVALLRALWAPSDTLLLDEPFTGMDPDTLQRAAALLRQEREVSLLSDLYSTAYDLTYEASPLTLTGFAQSLTRRQTVREVLEIGVVADSILALSATCGAVSVSREGGTAVLRTGVSVRALYLDEDIDIEAEAAKAEAARLAAQAEEAAGADAPDGSADGGESGEAAEEEDGGDD